MSELTIKYPTAKDMLDLIERPTLPDVPHRAMWWRLRLLPGPDGNDYFMQTDNMDHPTEVTISWHDEGRSESVKPYAVRILTDVGEAPDLGRTRTLLPILRTRMWLDLLTVEPPTSNPRWEAFTRPGNHRHPGDLEEIERRRADLGLLPTWAVR